MAILKAPLFTLISASIFGADNATEVKAQSRSFFDTSTSLEVWEHQSEAGFGFLNNDGLLSSFAEESKENTLATFRKYGCIKSLFGDLDDAVFTNAPVEIMPANISSKVGCALAQGDYKWNENSSDPSIYLTSEFVIREEKVGWLLGITGPIGEGVQMGTDLYKNLTITLSELEKKNGRWEVKEGDKDKTIQDKWTTALNLFGGHIEELYGKGEFAVEFELWKAQSNLKVMLDKGKVVQSVNVNKTSGTYTEYDENKRVSRNIKALLVEEISRDSSDNNSQKAE